MQPEEVRLPPTTQADTPKRFWVFQMVSVILGTIFISGSKRINGRRQRVQSPAHFVSDGFLADLDPNGTTAAGKEAVLLLANAATVAQLSADRS